MDDNEGAPPPSAIDYEGTLRVTPDIDGDRSFVEWWITFDCAPDECERWEAFLTKAISQWSVRCGPMSRSETC